MNSNFEYILEENATFLNIVKKSMIENFTESQHMSMLSLKFKKDLKVKKMDSLFSGIVFLNDKKNKNMSQTVMLTDKKGINWQFNLEKNNAELKKVEKAYGDFVIEYNNKTSYIKCYKPEAMLTVAFNGSVINKELVEMVAITTDYDIENLLGLGVDFFKFSKEDQCFMEKNKNKKLANTMKSKIKRLFS